MTYGTNGKIGAGREGTEAATAVTAVFQRFCQSCRNEQTNMPCGVLRSCLFQQSGIFWY